MNYQLGEGIRKKMRTLNFPPLKKFLLRDGETYLLKFPRRKNIRFRVPMRRERVVPVEQTHVDEEKWQLPEILYP